jgi:hypothetical protein
MVRIFSEKEYEMGFTFQFVENYRSILDDFPDMPSSRVEGSHPYDAGFRLIESGECHSIFFQFKKSNIIRHHARRNVDFSNLLGSPYLYFKIWPRSVSNQHNLMHDMREKNESIYYAAPLFHERHELFQNFRDRQIIDNSIFVDPLDIGKIQDSESHQIAYNYWSSQGYFASRIKQIPINSFKEIKQTISPKKIDTPYLEELSSLLLENLRDEGRVNKENLLKKHLPQKVQKMHLVYQCDYLLKNYYNLKWYLF